MSDIRRERPSVGRINQQPGRAMSWGAVIAGSVLTIAVQFMLGLLGLGIGLSSILDDGQGTPAAFLSASGLWALVVALVGLFVGAFATGRFAGVSERTSAALHGALTWATATVVVVALLTVSASAVVGGALGAVGTAVSNLTQAAGTTTPATITSGLPPQLESEAQTLLAVAQGLGAPASDASEEGSQGAPAPAQPASPANTTVDPGAIATLAAGVDEAAGPEERQAAIRLIAERRNLSEQAAEERLQGFQQSYDTTLRDIRAAADNASRSVTAAAFGAFVALLLGLIVGMLGAVLGRPKRQPL